MVWHRKESMQENMQNAVHIVGGGLAGCEAALWLARQAVPVVLYEQKPGKKSPAHRGDGLAELVCSNSLKAERLASAAGLLKEEMRRLGSHILPVAESCRVPAGGALAVDRDAFSNELTRQVQSHPGIRLVHTEVAALQPLLEQGEVLVCTGPLTEGSLAKDIVERSGSDTLYFFDAAAPIVTAESIDFTKVFAAARYGRGDADYLNCPFDKAGYETFHAALLAAERVPLHSFEKQIPVYEGCMPVEVMASRGVDTLRYGPLRPVGLTDPATGHRPYANVQLRRENTAGSLYNLVGFQTNLKFKEQERVFGLIPGLEKAEFVRHGVMHRNSFLNAPLVLEENQCLKGQDNLFFAGQITGVEGYIESAACGLLAGLHLHAKLLKKRVLPLPPETMLGALQNHMRTTNAHYQPMGANMGLLPPLSTPVKGKQARYEALAERALAALDNWRQSGENSGVLPKDRKE